MVIIAWHDLAAGATGGKVLGSILGNFQLQRKFLKRAPKRTHVITLFYSVRERAIDR